MFIKLWVRLILWIDSIQEAIEDERYEQYRKKYWRKDKTEE